MANHRGSVAVQHLLMCCALTLLFARRVAPASRGFMSPAPAPSFPAAPAATPAIPTTAPDPTPEPTSPAAPALTPANPTTAPAPAPGPSPLHFIWNVEYILWASDCRQRGMIGINGTFPGPNITAKAGDRIVVVVNNLLHTEGVVIHWHGIRQGGEAEVLATAADDGVPFTFVNGLDVDQATGDVYFSDSSRVFQRRHNVQIMYNRDATGRLLKYDARTKRVAVLKADLPYPNGVAVSGDRTHVVVAHTWPSKVFRYWIAGAKAGQYELFADVPGYPDNIRRDGTGGFWVALNREKIIFTAAGAPAPAPASSVPRPHLVGVRIDGRGKEQQLLTAPRGVTLSDVAEKDGKQLWLGSVELGYVGVVDYIMIR